MNEQADTTEDSQPLYHPAWQVPYQLDLAARAITLRRCALIADPGTGKGHVALAVACYGCGTGEAPCVLVVCEKGKLRDWRDETLSETGLRPVFIYQGAKRDEKLHDSGAQVVITTYETARESGISKITVPGKAKLKDADGPLTRWLKGKSVTVIWDEPGAKLKNRASGVYKAQERIVRALEGEPGFRLVALTATPLESGYENAFNMLRIAGPRGYMPLVGEFNERYVKYRDEYGRPSYRSDRMPEFAAIAAPRLLRKRKTDPDVREQFPPKTETFETAVMQADQKRLYRMTEDLAWDEHGDYVQVDGLSLALRLIAGHPAAVARGHSKLARLLTDRAGPAFADCSSAKTDLLLEHLRRTLDNDLKTLVFTFFGQTVLPVLAGRLRAEGIKAFVTHGGQSPSEQHEQRQAFRRHPGGAVLLSSDAGARGVNVPEADYVIEYESAVTSATRTQRFDRAHRLGRGSNPLTCVTYVLEGTCEPRLMAKALERNMQQDVLLGDESEEAREEGYLTGADRKYLFACARARRLAPEGM